MGIREMMPTTEQLKLVQGIEEKLLRRRRAGAIGGMVALAGAVFQVLMAAVEKDYPRNIGKFINDLVHLRGSQWFGPDGLPLPELTGVLVLVVGFGTYFLFRWTNFLLKESEEAFRYTFWIEKFKAVRETPGTRFTLKDDDRFHLLHHDLMERLNRRIRRLSLLDADANLPPEAKKDLTSHIHIRGDYALREEREGAWMIEVMPSIRIGPPSRPESLADPVKFPLEDEGDPGGEGTPSGGTEHLLHADRYNQIAEQVYSRIATEVYRQILADMEEKSRLFPTHYLQAVALFHEAKDFERSNTIDAYDSAIDLYLKSISYFERRFVGRVAKVLLRVPGLWRFAARSQLMEARARTGYSRSLIYRRVISAISGRYQNALFEIPGQLNRALRGLAILHNHLNGKWKIRVPPEEPDDLPAAGDLEETDRYRTLMAFLTFPRDSPFRRNQPLFDRVSESFFDACTVAALAYHYLGARQKAEAFFSKAKTVAPLRTQKNPLWLLAAAEIQPDLSPKLLFLRQAAEMSPDFEIAQYRLATYSEMRLRVRQEIQKERAEGVIREYAEVLRINPGNIGALAAQGYLGWVLGDWKTARQKFQEGFGVKAIVRQTFVGDLNYGLARIAAESGRLHRGDELYRQAMAADPGVGAYSATASRLGINSFYDFMVPEMLQRYERFKTEVERHIRRIEELPPAAPKLDAEGKEISSRTVNAVYGFVLNDYGNACLNYFHRFGDLQRLAEAIRAFEAAVEKNPENAVAYYNLSNAYGWSGESIEKIAECLDKAEKIAPAWPLVRIASTQTHVRQIQESINRKMAERDQKIQILKAVKRQKEEGSGRREEGLTGEKPGPPPEGSPASAVASGQNFRARIREQVDKIKIQNGEIRALREKLRLDIFPKIEKIMDQTRLSSLFAGPPVDYEGRGVRELVALNIEKGKLDENDIDALRVWAEVLSYHTTHAEALRSAEKLCRLIYQYYPQNFDTDLILWGVYGHLGQREEKEACRKRIQANISHWLAQDPIHYASLVWTRDFFDADSQAALIRRAMEREPDNPAYDHLLGNVYSSEKNYAAAARYYENACQRNGEIAIYHFHLARACRELKEWGKARREYEEALRIEPGKKDYRLELKLVLNDEGNAFYGQGDFRRAREKYEEAIRVDPSDAVIHSNLSLAGENLKEPGKRFAALEQAQKALEAAQGLDLQNREYAERLRQLERKKRVALHFGEKALDRILFVNPIAVEVAGNRKPDVESESGGLSPALNDRITEMRERVQKEMGVPIPGVRFRAGEDLPNGDYILMIQEIPLVRGRMTEDRRLFPGPLEALQPIGVTGEKTWNPRTGEEAVWIFRKSWGKMEKAGLGLWGFWEYLIGHLEAHIRKNLATFLGHQEVWKMLEIELPQSGREISDGAPLSVFTSVLRALVREEVPIVFFKEIVEKFRQSGPAEGNPLALAEAIRSLPEIRPLLPGNHGRFSFYRLGERLSRAVDLSLYKKGPQPVLAMPPLQVQNALQAIREKVGSRRNVALLVEKGEIRPFVRQLIEIEFPSLPVLSREELLPELRGQGQGEIELA